MQHVRVVHPLLERLRQLDREAAQLFPTVCDPGFGDLGLILDRQLDESRFSLCTPLNGRTFAHTGGDGVHFSLLVEGCTVCERSLVVMTVPAADTQNFVVGTDLFEFLCLGARHGFFALEQLAYEPDMTMEAYTNPDWQPTLPWHHSAGFLPRHKDGMVLNFLTVQLGLRPWSSSARFADLQQRYAQFLELPAKA